MSNHTYIIAEIGINHEGKFEQCAKMIDAAAKIGVDAVKLQTIDADKNYVVGSESYKVFKESELSREETSKIFKLAKDSGLDILTTSGDIETIEWVEKLNPSSWKISSGLLTHIPIVRHLASLGRPVLISSGMASIEELDSAVEVVRATGNEKISIFQCTSLYPAPFESINLSVINKLKERYGYDIGFSDHTLGSDAAFLSVGAGATLIEKHFSLDPSQPGFDHRISLDVDEFRNMVGRVRLAEKMMGSPKKIVSESLSQVRDKFLRSVVAICPISKGDVFSNKNIGVRRTMPGHNGCEPKYFDSMIGAIAHRDFNVNDPIIVKE